MGINIFDLYKIDRFSSKTSHSQLQIVLIKILIAIQKTITVYCTFKSDLDYIVQYLK